MFYTKPWKHEVIDNFFDDDTLQYCEEHLQSLLKKKKPFCAKQHISQSGRKNKKLFGINNKKILSHFDNIFTEEYLITNFPDHRSYKLLKSVAEYNIVTDDFFYGLHEESKSKILSVIVYLSPKFSIGTLLFNQSKEFKKQIIWEPNRALVFAGNKGTWHSYGHPSYVCHQQKTPRMTINYFKKYRKDMV